MLQINSAGFTEAIKSDSPVLIKLFGTYCNPCKNFAPIVELIATKNIGIAFLEMDVDRVPDVVTHLNITGVPTMVMFKSGIEIARLAGYQSEEKVQAFIDKNVHVKA